MAVTTVNAVPLFYGKDSDGKKDLSAKEFCRRIDNHLDRVDPPPAGRDRVSAITANLRGEACEWWTEYLPGKISKQEYRTACADPALFWTAFRREYYKVLNSTDASINWVGWKQTNGESAHDFGNRLCGASNVFGDLVVDPTTTVAAAGVQTWPKLAAAPATNRITKFLEGYAELNAAEKLLADEDNLDSLIDYREAYAGRFITSLVHKVMLNGIKDERLRPKLDECETAFTGRLDTLELVRGAENRLPKRNNNGNGNNRHGAAAIIEGDNDAEAAAMRGKDGKSKKSGKKDKKSGKKCGFCGIPGHTEADCFKRVAAQKLVKAEIAKKATGKSGTAATDADNGEVPLNANVGYQ